MGRKESNQTNKQICISTKRCLLGKFAAFLLAAVIKINVFKKNFQKYYQSGKHLGFRSGPLFCWPDLGPNCLQRLSADGLDQNLL